jgi:hypothetical protein
MPESLQHNEFDDFEVDWSGLAGCTITHIPCGLRVLVKNPVYLSYFTRNAITHAQMCYVVNSVGAHSRVD